MNIKSQKVQLPSRFTFPFLYTPHPLAVQAASELKRELERKDLGYDFESWDGKMFGVLVVEDEQGQLGYLKAFSGKMGDSAVLHGFVPPIYDRLLEDGFFIQGEKELNDMNRRIEVLEYDNEIALFQEKIEAFKASTELELSELRGINKLSKLDRQGKRKALKEQLKGRELETAEAELDRQSQDEQRSYKRLVKQRRDELAQLSSELEDRKRPLLLLKESRRQLSGKLQQMLFSEYDFLNKAGEIRNVKEIFKETVFGIPPAGAGDCAAPKLLQYAFSHRLRPIVMAEFWWGKSPAGEVRVHGEYYPACRGKCEPILSHMLQGIPLDPNPVMERDTSILKLEILYQDKDLLVIHKPAGLLSIPGKEETDSVQWRIRNEFPEATGPLIVHRLDMSTSGLMLIALNDEAYKDLQRQFLKRTVRKRYVAILEGELTSEQGVIDLPLRVDLENRPHQMVCHEHGKSARTLWKRVAVGNGKTLVHFFPVTGRTHQLRVHAAHPSGLGAPIIGDELYGHAGERLMLHAEHLVFRHPGTGKEMEFELPSGFTID